MASSMAAAAAHSMPPFPLPTVPRIRPPPIPKGTPGPNTIPQPGPAPRLDLVWVDGRWASPHSRSARHKQNVVSKQLEKALQHEVRGMNIYAYKHIRTHQVVYSLTKNMDNSKILKQLLYHGKKTVPAALRRDVWRPYFSVHFSQTPAGAMKGLKVFQELRELSALRQLSPSRDISITTKKDIEDMKLSYTPIEWTDKTENEIPGKKLLEVPVIGKKLPAQMLARRLMNQAATSVADVAAVLTRQTNPEEWRLLPRGADSKAIKARGPTPQLAMDTAHEKKQFNEDTQSIRAHNRLLEIRKKEDIKADQIEQRQRYLNATPGTPKVDKHTRDRISIEYDGVSNKLGLIEEADEATRAEIGTAELLKVTLEDIEVEKQTRRQVIEQDMSAEIEQHLNQMSEAQRSQIEKEVEAERAQKQIEIDAQVVATQQDLKEQRAQLYKYPSSLERTRALRKLSRDGHAKVQAMKIDLRARHLKWAGPFAPIADEIDKAIKSVDEAWEPRLVELREELKVEKERNADSINHEVEIRWANIRDGTHAKSWPDSVFHVELQSKAVSKHHSRAVTTHFHLDADEEPIETQYGVAEAPRRNTVHVFGSVAPDADLDDTVRTKGRYESPTELSAKQLEARNMRIQEWANTEVVLMRDRILAMRFEVQALKQQFISVPLDSEACPYIGASLDCIDKAEDILERMDRYNYRPTDIEEIEAQLEHASQVLHPYCLEELSSSAHPVADEARIKYMMLSAEVLTLQVHNLEAYRQAAMRETFLARFSEREKLADYVERSKNDPDQLKTDTQTLRTFDRKYPFIADILDRRESLYETLQNEIEDGSAEVERLKQEVKSSKEITSSDAQEEVTDSQDQVVTQLKDQLKAEEKALRANQKQMKQLQEENEAGGERLRQALRNDKEAWLEFKRSGGQDAYESGLGSIREPAAREKEGVQRVEEDSKRKEHGHGMVMEEPGPKPGIFKRVTNFVLRRKE